MIICFLLFIVKDVEYLDVGDAKNNRREEQGERLDHHPMQVMNGSHFPAFPNFVASTLLAEKFQV